MTLSASTRLVAALPMDATAPPDAAWGPMVAVALVVVAVVAAVVAVGRITRRRHADEEPTPRAGGTGTGTTSGTTSSRAGATTGGTTTDDPLPTDPQQHRPGQPGGSDGPDGSAAQPS